MSFFGFFKRIGTLVKRALSVVQELIPEETLALAVVWVRVAASKYVDNTARREFVVNILVNKGIPESIARLAVELAVQLAKRELT